MVDDSQGMVAFLGVPADVRLLSEDLVNLPNAEQPPEPAVSSRQHDRLVAGGSLLTGTTLVGGVVLLLFGGWQLLFEGGGALAAVLAVLGIVLAATHWGWVHVAEYAGLTIDEHERRRADERRQAWLATIAPYPRFSVSTTVLADASTRVERVLHRPILTPRNTFTFVREVDTHQDFGADAPAGVIAAAAETMRHQARLETDCLCGLWEAAATTYAAALSGAADDRQQLAAQRAAAAALSEHINASLLEPPLTE